MSELLNSSGLHSSTGTSTSNNLLSISDNTPVPQYTSMPMSESQAASLPPQTGTQGSALDESQARSDLFNVLANLQQNSVELGVLLQQQPHLLHELGAIAAGEVNPLPGDTELPVSSQQLQYESTSELPASSQQLQSTASSSEPLTSSSLPGQSLLGQLLPGHPLPGQPLPGHLLPGELLSEPSVSEPSVSAPPKPSVYVYKEQDRFLPIHNVARIMRNSIAQSGKVSKEAKECMQECVSEFISFLTSEAIDRCLQEKRKTITGDDILCAMATLGFDNHIEPLRVYLQNYREYMKVDKTADHSPPPAADVVPSTAGCVVARTMTLDELRSPLITRPPVVPVSSVLAMATQLPTTLMQ